MASAPAPESALAAGKQPEPETNQTAADRRGLSKKHESKEDATLGILLRMQPTRYGLADAVPRLRLLTAAAVAAVHMHDLARGKAAAIGSQVYIGRR